MSSSERLGILGGTFDPLHMGHFRAAESVREAMALDRVVFVPSRIPPHKSGAGLASAEDRFRMIKAAVKREPFFAVSPIELERPGPSYTIDTLSELGKQRPGDELFFITGIDSFREIQTWHRWEELLESYALIVHGRPGSGRAAAYAALPERLRPALVDVGEDGPPPQGRGGVVYLIQAVMLDISSTQIRALVRAGRSTRYLVPPEVEAYIGKHRLYREGD